MSVITTSDSLEKLSGIVKRVTFHSAETGWSVLKITPFGSPQGEIAVTVHQSKVFAGATIDFYGQWINHPTYGRQFQAQRVEERKPASAHALEKYLGSGLIKGVGPKTARKIVKHFGADTLSVFEGDIDRLTEVEGIAQRKLTSIQEAWQEHQHIREVMMFLQSHGISTLFAVKIYKTYGRESVKLVQENPYRLAQDIYGIGFFSADRVALSLGLAENAIPRIQAGISHVLQNAREEGHCYLTQEQIIEQTLELLALAEPERIDAELTQMEGTNELRTRRLSVSPISVSPAGEPSPVVKVYYAPSLYHDENYIAQKARKMVKNTLEQPASYLDRIQRWVARYCEKHELQLSDEQQAAVRRVVTHRLSILTGGPGCGKTTTTRVIVALLLAMKKEVMLAAPTGRAAQRMGEVIGQEAKTLHRLLGWNPTYGGFQHNEENPLPGDFIIIDEASMLDVHLAASLLRAISADAQLLLIGDADQLPSVGAGNVLQDLMTSHVVPVARLTQVFRQAAQSQIIQYAHQLNEGRVPDVHSPFRMPQVWQQEDCLFIDSDEATQEQLRFISRIKRLAAQMPDLEASLLQEPDEAISAYQARQPLTIPEKFQHVDLEKLATTEQDSEALKEVLRRVHPFSSLHWGHSAVDMVVKLYTQIIPKYHGADTEVQILSPMSKGSLGTHNLNEVIQQAVNPPTAGKAQVQAGGRLFRVDDRVIQRRNNYELNVFNGDIGRIIELDSENLSGIVSFSQGQEVKEVVYERAQLPELELAYAITIHKSQGSEFEAVILPLLPQHFTMLYRNLLYTGLTRARKIAVLVGSRWALRQAVGQQNTSLRQTALRQLVEGKLVE